MMQVGITTHLLANGPLTGAVGTHISWASRPQGEALPGLVLFRLPGTRDVNMAGRSGLVETRVQIDSWAADYLSAAANAKLALKAFDSLPGQTISGVDFLGAFPEGDRDDYEGDLPDRKYRTSFDVRVWHTED
jgi:hypothetical protein